MTHNSRRVIASKQREGIGLPREPARKLSRRAYLGVAVSIAGVLIVGSVWLQGRRSESPSRLASSMSGSQSVERPTKAGDTSFRRGLDPRYAAAKLHEVKSLKNEARGIADLLVVSFPEDPYAYDVLAAVQYRLFGDASKADELWKKAIELDEEFLAAYFGRTNIAWSRGDFDTVIDLMQRVLRQDPHSSDARHYFAHALLESGRFQDAIDALKAGEQQTAESVSTDLLLAKAYMQLDDFENAGKYFEHAIRLNPKSREGYYGLAQAYQRLGRGDEAQSHLEKSQSLKSDASSHDDRSVSEQLMESDATLVRQEVIATCLAAGEVHRNHGDLPGAEKYWRRAAALDPSDPRIRQALGQLYK